MFNKRYRLIDIARQIDRDKTTIIRWEELGFISPAKRDSRGWRYYSKEEVDAIVKKVQQTNYFRDSMDVAPGNGAKAHRMVYIGVVVGVMLMVSQLFMLGIRTYGATADHVAYTTVSAGTLAILSASTTQSFDAAVSV